jgi:quercetin dioxygenase-like cupin family protein
MALPHATHMDVINVAPLGDRLEGTVSTSLIKTDRIQLLHLVLAENQDQPQHHVDDECTLHCLEGVVELVTGAGVRRMTPGSIVVLPARQRHALRARTAAAVLVTLLLHGGDAGDQGGAGRRAAPDKDAPVRP